MSQLDEALDKLSPLGVLQRGYAVVRDANGKLVRDASTRDPGDRVEVTMAKGELGCEVVEVNPAKDS